MLACAIMYDIIMQNNLLCFKIVNNKKEIKFFVMDMTFILSPEGKKNVQMYISLMALPLIK